MSNPGEFGEYRTNQPFANPPAVKVLCEEGFLSISPLNWWDRDSPWAPQPNRAIRWTRAMDWAILTAADGDPDGPTLQDVADALLVNPKAVSKRLGQLWKVEDAYDPFRHFPCRRKALFGVAPAAASA